MASVSDHKVEPLFFCVSQLRSQAVFLLLHSISLQLIISLSRSKRGIRFRHLVWSGKVLIDLPDSRYCCSHL